jgi:uncharacterized repeat protein (TIGR01451 family)
VTPDPTNTPDPQATPTTVVPTSTPSIVVPPDPTSTPAPTLTATPRPASLGDYTWVDTNRDGKQDANEQPLANVPVTLRGPDITLTTTTSITGYYRFDGLTPGVPYVVVFGTLPGYQLTQNSGGVDVPDNSDANPRTGEAPAVTLQPGEHNPRIDAGFFTDARQAGALTIAKRSLSTGAVRAGSLITYELVVRNTGDTLATGVVLTDPVPLGTSYVDSSATPAAAFNGQAVVWTIGDLGARESYVARFTVRVAPNTGTGAIRNVARVSSKDTTETLTSNEVTTVFAPTAIALDAFSVVLDDARGGDSAIVLWRTALELDSAGFHIWRTTTDSRLDAVRVNSSMIPARNAGGASYQLIDPQGNQPGARYWIEEVGLSGLSSWHGPVALGAIGIQPPPPQIDLVPVPLALRPDEPAPVTNGAGQSVVSAAPVAVPVATQVAIAPGLVLVPVPAPVAVATSAPLAEPAQPTVRPRAVSIGDSASEYAPTEAAPEAAVAAPVAPSAEPAATSAAASDSATAPTNQRAQPLSGIWLTIAAAASLGVIAIVSGIGMALLMIRRRKQ